MAVSVHESFVSLIDLIQESHWTISIASPNVNSEARFPSLDEQSPKESTIIMTAELPHPDAVLEAPGLTCATLTPAIKEHLRDLASGQVLEVRCDDPAAKEAVPSWNRLTGHSIRPEIVLAIGRRPVAG